MPGFVWDGAAAHKFPFLWVWDGASAKQVIKAWAWDGTESVLWYVFEVATETKTWTDELLATDALAQEGFSLFILVDAATLEDAFTRNAEDRTTIRAWTDDLTVTELLAFVEDRDLFIVDAATLSDLFARTTQNRNTTKTWGETISASDAISRVITLTLSLADTASFSEVWNRNVVHTNQITDATWLRTQLLACPTPSELHCVRWNISGDTTGMYIRIHRSTNGGAYSQVESGISPTTTQCSGGGFNSGHTLPDLGFGDHPTGNWEDQYRYKVELRLTSDNSIVDTRETATIGSSHHDCIE